MIIAITPTIRIRYEERNYMLERELTTKSGPNTGRTRWEVVGYYGDLATAARSVPDRHLYLFDPEDQELVMDSLEKLGQEIARVGQLVADAVRVAIDAQLAFARDVEAARVEEARTLEQVREPSRRR